MGGPPKAPVPMQASPAALLSAVIASGGPTGGPLRGERWF
jgi:hypothetical protein